MDKQWFSGCFLTSFVSTEFASHKSSLNPLPHKLKKAETSYVSAFFCEGFSTLRSGSFSSIFHFKRLYYSLFIHQKQPETSMSHKKQDAYSQLITALRVLPNVGAKTAQRMAHVLLQQNRDGAQELLQALDVALKQVHNCQQCNTFCEGELCAICADEQRDTTRLMIVHMPADVAAMEAARCHDGVYFVLMGQVNPTQNMNLSHIALDKLVARLAKKPVNEIIIATSFTAEGDATAYILSELFKEQPYKISRLARGMPLGSELEYVDAGTLAQAVYERQLLQEQGNA